MALLFGFGQLIDSDRPIAGALGGDLNGDAGLRIRHLLPTEIEPAAVYAHAGGRLIFTPPGVGRYRCSAHDIRITPATAADPEEVAALLIATALPVSLWMQGRFMLHAAALRLPGARAAIAVAGPSGIGKSLIAAQLIARGAALLADDSIAVATGADGLMVSGLPGGYFATIDNTNDRKFVAVAAERSIAHARLGALFIVSRTDNAPSMERLDRLAAVEQILANRHRPTISAVLGLQAQGPATAVLLSRDVPVYAWQRRQGEATLDDKEMTMLEEASR